ncbi:MAG TPA: nitrogen fixation protein NifB [Firmicutes bacterium]|nr:nitrogen fixation protein NifB [Bacillota bacterium]
MERNIFTHPCFNQDARHQFGRIHLPVAPKCNIQCNYCNRKYNCANENRPGVTTATLNPNQAMLYLEKVVTQDSRIAVVGIAGPGDPFANPVETLKTLRMVREKYPQMLLCVSTNGLNLNPYISELINLQVSHVTVTINAIDPVIGAKIYSWVRDGKVIYRGQKGAEVILERQLDAVRSLKQAGMIVKINTLIIPEINDQHLPEVASKMAALGADIMNCIPLLPTKDTVFEEILEPSAAQVQKIRTQVKAYLPQMEHCTRCRADAVGLLGEAMTAQCQQQLLESSRSIMAPGDERPYVAVASMEGVLINQHLGEAERILIYEKTDNEFKLIETRETPEAGTGKQRWLNLAQILHDCRCLLVSGIGESPREILEHDGMTIFVTEGLIGEELKLIFAGKTPHGVCSHKAGCGLDCSGGGMGCG